MNDLRQRTRGKLIADGAPDDVRGDADTLGAAVRTRGWPVLGDARAKLVREEIEVPIVNCKACRMSLYGTAMKTDGIEQAAVDRATGKVLFDRPRLEVSERYEISQDPRQYFEESDDALNRASVVVARQVVSAILNNF